MRLIDADAFDKRLVRLGALSIKSALDEEPAIEAEPVRHGRWVNSYINFYGHPCHCCSECGFKASYQDKNYCPNCGCKMSKENDDAIN